MSTAANRGRTPVSADHLVSVAVELTREHGLNAWTIRDLEHRAKASPSSIYHRVGSRDRLVARVVDSVLQRIALPTSTEDWREFYRIATERLYFGLTPYAGAASWLMVGAPALDGNLAFMQAGIARLTHAGVIPAGLAHSQISNTALGVISAAEQRTDGIGHVTQDVVERLGHAFPSAEPRDVDAVRAFVSAFDLDDRAELRAARLDYFRAAVDVAIAGVDAGYRSGSIRGIDRFT